MKPNFRASDDRLCGIAGCCYLLRAYQAGKIGYPRGCSERDAYARGKAHATVVDAEAIREPNAEQDCRSCSLGGRAQVQHVTTVASVTGTYDANFDASFANPSNASRVLNLYIREPTMQMTTPYHRRYFFFPLRSLEFQSQNLAGVREFRHPLYWPMRNRVPHGLVC